MSVPSVVDEETEETEVENGLVKVFELKRTHGRQQTPGLFRRLHSRFLAEPPSFGLLY